MSDGIGAIAGAAASLGGAALTADEQAQIASQWQNLTAQQQAFLQNQLAKIEAVQAPQFNTNLPPPTALALQNYGAPVLGQATNVAINPEDRANQMAALQKLQSVSSGAADSELNAANYRAMSNAAQQQGSANAGILQDLAARGTLGSGQELAAKMQAGQNAAQNSQAGMLQAAQGNALAKLQAQNAYLQGMGALRGQDTGLASENANIANQFNLHNTGLQNQINQMNTGLGNQQTMFNTQQNNAYQQALLNLQNTAAQQNFQNKLGQAQAGAGEANTISQQAMGAGATQGALNAGVASTIAGGIGGALNSLAGMGGGQSGNPYENVTPDQAPVDNQNKGTDFTGEEDQNFA